MHSSDLEKAASQTASSLQTAKTEQALAPKLRRLGVLARNVSDELKQLRGAHRDKQRALASKLQSAADESKQIGKGLK